MKLKVSEEAQICREAVLSLILKCYVLRCGDVLQAVVPVGLWPGMAVRENALCYSCIIFASSDPTICKMPRFEFCIEQYIHFSACANSNTLKNFLWIHI